MKFYNNNNILNNNNNNNYNNYNNSNIHTNTNNYNIIKKNINNKDEKLDEIKDKKNNSNPKYKPNYLKKMIIDVNNINEKSSKSPQLYTIQNKINNTNNNLNNSNNINNINNNNYNINQNPLFTSWNRKTKLNQEKEKSEISNLLSSSSQNHKFNFYLPEINQSRTISKLKKNINIINNNLDTQSTTNESKKINSNGNNTDEYSKDRIDLMSANFISNLNINSATSNIIIPMIPLKRPNSNFNIGGNNLWEKIDNLNSKIINTEQMIDKRNINNYNNLNNVDSKNLQNSHSVERGKVSTAPLINNNNMKLHKIKIEKGMMNTKLADSINRKMYNFEVNEYYLNNNLYNKCNKNSYRQLSNNNNKQPFKISKNKINSNGENNYH